MAGVPLLILNSFKYTNWLTRDAKKRRWTNDRRTEMAGHKIWEFWFLLIVPYFEPHSDEFILGYLFVINIKGWQMNSPEWLCSHTPPLGHMCQNIFQEFSMATSKTRVLIERFKRGHTCDFGTSETPIIFLACQQCWLSIICVRIGKSVSVLPVSIMNRLRTRLQVLPVQTMLRES